MEQVISQQKKAGNNSILCLKAKIHVLATLYAFKEISILGIPTAGMVGMELLGLAQTSCSSFMCSS